MTRRFLTFDCAGSVLNATLDEGDAATGLLIVSGGTAARSGAFGWQAMLAAHIAAAGFPVFRFDRRGVGDSEGDDPGFRGSTPDIAAAARSFRRETPHVRRIVGFGNCDAASALMLSEGAGPDALLLANPWSFDEGQEQVHPPATVRSRLRQKIGRPDEWKRLAKGEVSFSSIRRTATQAARGAQPASNLMQEMQAGLTQFGGAVRLVIAGRDRTAQAFRHAYGGDAPVQIIEEADHAFSSELARTALYEAVSAFLHEQTGELDMGGPSKLSDGA